MAGLIVTPGYDLWYLGSVRGHRLSSGDGTRHPVNRRSGDHPPRLISASLRGVGGRRDPGLTVRDWVDGQNPVTSVALALGGHARVAVTDLHAGAAHAATGRKRLGAPGAGHADHGGLWMIKDPAEIDALREAGGDRPGACPRSEFLAGP